MPASRRLANPPPLSPPGPALPIRTSPAAPTATNNSTHPAPSDSAFRRRCTNAPSPQSHRDSISPPANEIASLVVPHSDHFCTNKPAHCSSSPANPNRHRGQNLQPPTHAQLSLSQNRFPLPSPRREMFPRRNLKTAAELARSPRFPGYSVRSRQYVRARLPDPTAHPDRRPETHSQIPVLSSTQRQSPMPAKSPRTRPFFPRDTRQSFRYRNS